MSLDKYRCLDDAVDITIALIIRRVSLIMNNFAISSGLGRRLAFVLTVAFAAKRNASFFFGFH